MATEEPRAAAAAVEQREPEPVTKEEAKPVKEKKSKAPREKKPKIASHPPYFQMIKEALMALNEKSGSSPYAIAKYMEEKHKAVLPANFKKILGSQLKNAASRGKLIKIKASYKLSEENEQTKKKSKAGATNKAKEEKRKKKARRVRSRKTRSVNTKPESGANKKVGAKKAKKSTVANKPKQPKSIKSPAAKRTRRTAAVVASAS